MYRNSEQYYEMKYYKYKAKIEKLKGGSKQEKKLNIALIDACKKDNIGEVRRLLDEGADVGFVYKQNQTLLSLVLSRYDFNMEIFRLLVQYSSSETVNKNYGYNHNTLLHLVLEYHENLEEHLEEILRLLLDKGAIESFNKPNRYSETIFYLACNYNLLNVVILLLEYEPIYNEFLQNSPRDIEPTNIVNTVYGENTPLYIACRNGNIEIVRHLLQNGADTRINEGNNNSDDLEVEVDHYLDVDEDHHLEVEDDDELCIIPPIRRQPAGQYDRLQDYNGHTPLFIAYIKNDRDLVLLLLRYGANPEIPQLSARDNYYKVRIFHSLDQAEKRRIYGYTDVELEIIMNRGEIDQIIFEQTQQTDLYKKGAKCK